MTAIRSKDILKSKRWLYGIASVLIVLIVVTIGGSFFMLDFALSPEEHRTDTAVCYKELFETYPETRPWMDSLRRKDALRDTFVTMTTGERHHSLYVNKGSDKTALILHGWRDCAVDFLYLARLYEQLLGYNVVIPDFHAHGLSEGNSIQMGWNDRWDMLQWLSIFKSDTMLVHGVSMGGATAMMMSAERMPEGVKDIHYVVDCGYTSVWDEFKGELNNQFSLPAFPLMYTTSLLCKILYGWSFQEASAIEQVKRCQHPMLFIHGDSDTFVPTEMVYRLYEAKPSRKDLWVTKGATHAESYLKYKEEYLERLKHFLHE